MENTGNKKKKEVNNLSLIVINLFMMSEYKFKKNYHNKNTNPLLL